MKVKELINRLEDLDPEMEVRIMHQQNWPFEYSIRGCTLRSEFEFPDEEEDSTEETADCVFIVEGTQLGYGNRAAWDAVS